MFDPRIRVPTILDYLPSGTWPHPDRVPRDGLGALGGDLTLERILSAYDHGFFPCYGAETPRLWWCPDPRAVFLPNSFHTSARLERKIRAASFRVTWNTAFTAVMVECGERRDDGRWIVPEMIDVYAKLHALHHAYSIEVWRGERLVGGAYGVQRGAVFAAESMFHIVTDASKVALGYLLESLFAAGILLVDVQYLTSHLRSLGATTLRRADYVSRLTTLTTTPVDLRSIALKAPIRRVR